MKSKAYWRIVTTIVSFILLLTAHWVWSLFGGSLGGQLTANQLDDTTAAAVTAKAASSVPAIMNGIFAIIVLLIWGPYLRDWVRSKRATNSLAPVAMFLSATSLFFTSCGPAKVLDAVEIKPNETAWVVPLDTKTEEGQKKFDSVEFLEAKKVASKRIMIDKTERSTGRGWWNYEWLPASRVIRVDRSLVTNEWTDSTETGTSKQKQGIQVVTKDSIRLMVGLTITASIEEKDASTYLYYHGERALSEVVDTNVRSYSVAKLTDAFSKMPLSEAQSSGNKIYQELFDSAKVEFLKVGITVHFLGNAEGVHYEDPKIQAAINDVFLAEQSQKTAQQKQMAQKIENETLVQKAKAQADAAENLFQVQEATRLQNELEISLNQSKAALEMAQKWNGALPASILPSNSPLLLNLGAGAAPSVSKSVGNKPTADVTQ